MMNVRLYAITLILLLHSCTKKQERRSTMAFAPQVVESKGHIVSQDSVGKPKVILAGKPHIVLAGKPRVVLTNTNVHPAGKPKVVLVGKPRVVTPGQDTFLLPKTVPAIDHPFLAGVPEVVTAKDAYIKDQNPHSFSTFSKLQGLKHDVIRCMLQDRNGNLWFGTYGGASKYDGKSFTHFTQKEGLSNNAVYSILQDQSGNLWFGTYAGVSKYDGKNFTHYTEKEGLSNNSVWSILQDQDGNLWFGTNGGGVSKYDGKSFTHYTEKEGLSNNTVNSILQDQGGNLWFGTDGGVSRYDGKSFTHFTEKEGLSKNIVWSILQDQGGNLWFGTYSGGVSKYDGKTFTHFTEKEGLSSNTVYSILQDKNGNLWFGTDGGGVSEYDGNRVEVIERGEKIPLPDQQDLKKINGKPFKPLLARQASFTHFTEKEGLSNNRVRCILQDKNGNLWFSTYGGVSKYDGKCFTHYTEKEGLSNNHIHSILQDKSRNLWFATDYGVNKYDGKCFTHFTQKEGLCNNYVTSILQDKNGNLWFGTYEGVSKYDGECFTNFTEKEGLSNNLIQSIFQDQSGNLWFGTAGGGVSKYDGNRVEAIEKGEKIPLRDQQDLKRIDGKLVKTFTHFTEKEGLNNNFVSSILQDQSGNLWFATNYGVSKYDGKFLLTGQAGFTHFTEKEGLSNNTVYNILQDKNGDIWFGTNGGGVSKYDGNRVEAIGRVKKIPLQDLKKINGKLVKSFTHFTEKEGLSSNAVLSILQDQSGNLWFGTRFGLSKLTQKNLARCYTKPDDRITENYGKSVSPQPILFKNFTYEDGFLGVGCIQGAIYEDNTGTIWTGTNGMLTAYHPEGEKTDTIPPNTQLTGIELFNESIPWVHFEQEKDARLTLGNGVTVSDFRFDGTTQWYDLPCNLSLRYNNNFLTFRFIGITQKQSKKVKYQYTLEGLDESWSSPTLRNEASYGNLPHGAYNFRVKAMNSEGYWSNEFSYAFTIRPPWWKTWWFRAFTVFLFAACLFGYIRWRTSALKRQKELLEQLVKEKTAEVILQREKIQAQASKLQLQNTKLQELGELKQGLTSMIVHDLKNPLNLILNIPTSIRPEKQIDVMQKSGKQMLNMVLNILDVDKYENTSMILNLEDKQFVLIAINAIKQVQFLSEQKGIVIKNKIEHGLIVQVEEEIVERILVNLLTNAIKYTPLNGEITLRSNPISASNVRIEIQDTGEGIPEDKIHLVFQKFGQVVAKKSGGVRSTGLGLTFCKIAVEAHGGEIGLNTELGKGTTFWFTLRQGNNQQAQLQAIEIEKDIEIDNIVFTREEKRVLRPTIKELMTLTVYETDDVEEILSNLKQCKSENILKWISQIEKQLVTLNHVQYLNLMKIR